MTAATITGSSSRWVLSIADSAFSRLQFGRAKALIMSTIPRITILFTVFSILILSVASGAFSAENYLYISLGAFGAAFLLRPLVIVILSLAIGVIVYSVMQRRTAFAVDEADG